MDDSRMEDMENLEEEPTEFGKILGRMGKDGGGSWQQE